MTTKRQKQRIETLAKLCAKAHKANPELWFDDEGTPIFDYPDYGGLPKRTAYSLSSDCVDVIQGYLLDVQFGRPFRQKDLARHLVDYADSGYDIRK